MEITEEKVDAVTFTSAPQIRFLTEYAGSRGMLQAMLEAFETGVLAVAVGRITADALKEAGIRRIVMPEQERMGSMIVEQPVFGGSSLAAFFVKITGAFRAEAGRRCSFIAWLTVGGGSPFP